MCHPKWSALELAFRPQSVNLIFTHVKTVKFAGIVHAMGHGEPSAKWYGQQAVYRVSMGNFVSLLCLEGTARCLLVLVVVLHRLPAPI